LTGESTPVEKTTAPTGPDTLGAERPDFVFMGTSVATGPDSRRSSRRGCRPSSAESPTCWRLRIRDGQTDVDDPNRTGDPDRRRSRSGLPLNVTDAGLVAVIGGLVGAKLLWTNTDTVAPSRRVRCDRPGGSISSQLAFCDSASNESMSGWPLASASRTSSRSERLP